MRSSWTRSCLIDDDWKCCDFFFCGEIRCQAKNNGVKQQNGKGKKIRDSVAFVKQQNGRGKKKSETPSGENFTAKILPHVQTAIRLEWGSVSQMAATIHTTRLLALVLKQHLDCTGPLLADGLPYVLTLIQQILAGETLPALHCIARPASLTDTIRLVVAVIDNMQV